MTLIPPDIAGPIARCDDCGTQIGPIIGPSTMSITVVCGCGVRLEAWPEPPSQAVID